MNVEGRVSEKLKRVVDAEWTAIDSMNMAMNSKRAAIDS
jgi:hypothetical protein